MVLPPSQLSTTSKKQALTSSGDAWAPWTEDSPHPSPIAGEDTHILPSFLCDKPGWIVSHSRERGQRGRQKHTTGDDPPSCSHICLARCAPRRCSHAARWATGLAVGAHGDSGAGQNVAAPTTMH